MQVDHEKNALGAGYIVEFIHDATENYYGGRNIRLQELQEYQVSSICVENLEVMLVLPSYAS